MRFRRRNRAALAKPVRGPIDHRGNYSLFGEILDWMLAPLLFLWPISIIATYDVALRIANQPYDELLSNQVQILAQLLRRTPEGELVVVLPQATSHFVRSSTENASYYQLAAADGRLLAGDAKIPQPLPADSPISREVQFRDADINGEDIRIAYLGVSALNGHTLNLVQIAETRHTRNALSARIVSGVLLPQFAIIPLAVLLVWFGLSRGIAPLNRLQGLIRRRDPGDLSPVGLASVPEEVRPLVTAFNDMMARLDDNLDAQQRFIADAAHQMRTPLAGLRIQTELALSEPDVDTMRAALTQVLVGTERAARLINQLLSLARAEATADACEDSARVDIDLLLRSVVAEHVPAALAKEIDLGVDSAGMPLWFRGASVLLQEMLHNLIDNALKYSPAGGHVTAVLRWHEADEIVIEVQDDGPGIPEEERAQVFERFYRVLGTGVEGSGLGLPIVREIAELHGGSVSIGDGPGGRGASLRVSLPIKLSEA